MHEQLLVQITRRKQFAEDEFWTMMVMLREQQEKRESFLPAQLPLEKLPHKRARNFVTPRDAPIPDCLTCGACCTFLFAVGLNLTDQTPLASVWDVTRKTKALGETVIDRFLKRDVETFYCAELDMISESGKALCRIYQQRPHACHNFEAGSDKCHGLRRLYGFEPELTVMEMFSAVQILETQSADSETPPAKIRRAQIIETAETGELAIVGVMDDGSEQLFYVYDPSLEFWMQFEFAGLTLAAARDLILTRKEQTAKVN